MALAAVSLALVLRTGQAATIPAYNWYPGYYVLNHIDTAAAKQAILDDPLVAPFTGVQFRYHWAASELSPGDYSAGFASLDADLERVAAKGKKILVMLTYKKFDGTSAVPADLRTGPGAWCSGSYCGDFAPNATTRLALVWNPAVEARLKAWITAMAHHLSESPYIDHVAGIVLNETSVSTSDTTVLASANYDPNVYLQALQDNMLAATTAAPRLITILYFEGGFVSMDGTSVRAGQKFGDWMLLHPRTGAGTPDAEPKDPKGTNHPCANSKYQSSIACAPAVQSKDYSTTSTDSFDQTFHYATDPVPSGLHGSFLTFSYAVGAGPNAFTFADVSNNIASHPIPNTTRPWPVDPIAGPPVANDDNAGTSEGTAVTINVAANDTDPDGDLDTASASTNCPACTTPTNGALVNNGDGTFGYTPNPAFSGADSFIYEICDSRSACDTASVIITVGNQPPVITSDSGGDTASLSIPENQIAVTDVDATDPDAGDALSYSIVGGADSASFMIEPTTGDLAFLTAPSFESPTDLDTNNVYQVVTQVSDGNGGVDTQVLSVAVSNVNEFPPEIVSNGSGATAAVSVPENQSAVTDVDATDLDLTSPTYSIAGGPDAARFSIVPATGVLTFSPPPNFEAPTDTGANNVYEVTVQASDGSLFDTQAIAVTVTDVVESAPLLYFSVATAQTLSGIPVTPQDIVAFDGVGYSLLLDGSDVGLDTIEESIDAFAVHSDGRLMVSTTGSFTVGGGLSGKDEDVIALTASSLGATTTGTWTMYFDGSTVGLLDAGEDVDALEPLADGRLLISTSGVVNVTGVTGEDEDVLEYTPGSPGTWALYFDGSDVALTASSEDVDGMALDAEGRIYLSTTGNFGVSGLSGADEDVFRCNSPTTGANTACSSFSMFFDGSTFGVAANDVFAIELP